MEKIIEEKNKNINIKKNKGDKYTHNIGVINNKFINKPKDKIIIDANNIGKIKIDNNTNNTNKLQQYKKIFNGTSTSIVYNKMKTNKNEEVKNITKYMDKNNKMKNEMKIKVK
jgi:GTPase involved in cell partitioning and DNA repair